MFRGLITIALEVGGQFVMAALQEGFQCRLYQIICKHPLVGHKDRASSCDACRPALLEKFRIQAFLQDYPRALLAVSLEQVRRSPWVLLLEILLVTATIRTNKPPLTW